jgi:agmatinase
MAPLTTPVAIGQPTFLNLPRCNDLAALDADIAIIGVPYTVPYTLAESRQPSATAPATVREQSNRAVWSFGHYDFDFGGPALAGRSVRIVDCGDVYMESGQYAANAERTQQAIAAILDRGAVPLVLGGDHAVPIPVFKAYAGRADFVVVQLDAHIDWRDEVNGIREGLSSPMRRASEMQHVRGMAQIGVRAVGSARLGEVEAARAYGSILITADELHEQGVESALARIPQAANYYLTIDLDGLDPAIAPGVGNPAFGGLSYYEAIKLIRGVAARGRLAGFDIVEIQPERDVQNLTSLLGARLVIAAMAALAQTGQVGI